MASRFYLKQVPDYKDLDNKSGECRGYDLLIVESDGGIGIEMAKPNTDINIEGSYSVFLNVNEAIELKNCLQEAIDRALPKNKERLLHKNRAK